MIKKRESLLILLSWALVTFGQPHVSAFLSLLASGCGIAIFWKALAQVEGKKRRFALAMGWFSAAQLIQLSWMASPRYQGFYIIFVYLALACWLGLEFGLLTLLLPDRTSISLRRLLLISGTWTLFEWSRLFVFCGFVWNPLGLTLTAHPFPAQLAALWGVFGLSFWVMVVNLLAFNVFVLWSKRSLMLFLGGYCLPYLLGALHVGYHTLKQQSEGRKELCVALVQPSLLPDQKNRWQAHPDRFVSPFEQWWRILNALETAHKDKVEFDLIVLPEAAVPFDAHLCVYPYRDVAQLLSNVWKSTLAEIKLSPSLAEKGEGGWRVSNAFWAQTLANHYQAEVVIGLSDQEKKTGKIYNSAFHFTPKSDVIKRYDKQILLPLAEYLPLSFLRPLVARYGITGLFTPGEGAKVFGKRCPLSVSICYEECFGHRMREGRKKGAELFVNVTNDGWYPSSRLPEQHFTHSYLRTIENGVPSVRACNTGVSAAIDSLGRLIDRLEDQEGKVETVRGALVTLVPLYTYSTLYTLWGDGLIVIIAILAILIGISEISLPLRKIKN